MELLRGAADGERQARLPPRPRPRLQGHLPALQGDGRPLRAAQGRLGLPRPAGRARDREGARARLEGADRGVRDRRVQRPLPRVRLPLRRRLGPDGRARRPLDRPRRPLRDDGRRLHRVGLVVAAAALGPGQALRGPQGRSLLPALRHGAELARGRAGIQGRRRSLRLRAPAGDRGRRRLRPRAWRQPARVDDDPLDADQPRGRRRRPGGRVRARLARGLRRGDRRSPRRWPSGCSARATRSTARRPAPRWRAPPTRRPSTTSRARTSAPTGTRC